MDFMFGAQSVFIVPLVAVSRRFTIAQYRQHHTYLN